MKKVTNLEDTWNKVDPPSVFGSRSWCLSRPSWSLTLPYLSTWSWSVKVTSQKVDWRIVTTHVVKNWNAYHLNGRSAPQTLSAISESTLPARKLLQSKIGSSHWELRGKKLQNLIGQIRTLARSDFAPIILCPESITHRILFGDSVRPNHNCKRLPKVLLHFLQVTKLLQSGVPITLLLDPKQSYTCSFNRACQNHTAEAASFVQDI